MPKKKLVIDLDDLYLLFYTHWVLDDQTYNNEHQRVQVIAELLAAVFFGCWSCSLFNIWVKLDEGLGKPADDDQSNAKYELNNIDMDAGRDTQRKCIGDIVMAINSDCKFDSDFSTACENDSDSDFSSVYHTDNNDCDTDDDCDAGSEKTRAFLYRHFTIIIASNETPGKPNMIFMKVTLLHTKDEDNNPQM